MRFIKVLLALALASMVAACATQQAMTPLKAALEDSLRASGYLASGAPKYQVDAEINNLQQPFAGLDLDVTADVTYKVSGAGSVATYPIKSMGQATFSDSPIAADRLRIANERAMQENIKQFLQALK